MPRRRIGTLLPCSVMSLESHAASWRTFSSAKDKEPQRSTSEMPARTLRSLSNKGGLGSTAFCAKWDNPPWLKPLPTVHERGTCQSLSLNVTFTRMSHRPAIKQSASYLRSTAAGQASISGVWSSDLRTRISSWPRGTPAWELEGLGRFQSTERSGEKKRPKMKVNPPLIELKSENHGESEKEQKPLVTWRNSSFGSKAKQREERNIVQFSMW